MKFELEINETDKEVFKKICIDKGIGYILLYMKKEYSTCMFNVLRQIEDQIKNEVKSERIVNKKNVLREIKND